ncbi:MAG: hypothetical protein CMJ64_16520 [Planctomycetaceae bacterium]|nr:hypothetical protein [Planctomycetaceae bacterium]
MARRQFLWSSVIVSLLLPAASLLAQLPSTQLSSVFPPGGKFGTTVDVQVAGADQVDLQKLVFSHPGIVAAQKMHKPNEFLDEQPLAGQFTVTIAGDVPSGVYQARVVGRYGVSNPRAFTVGVYDELHERGGNTATTSAAELKVDSTISGWVDANNRDYFKIALTKGQKILLDCVSERIDSRMDATLVVFDPSGREIAKSRDHSGADPFIALTAPSDGEYIVMLYDFLYRGGNDYFYRLAAHTGPHVEFIFPPAGLPGSNEQYTIYGRNLPGGEPSDYYSVAGQPLQKLTVSIPVPADGAATNRLAVSGRVEPRAFGLDNFMYRFNTASASPVYFAHAPVVAEQEPNNESGQSQAVTVPCEVAGQFYPAGDKDYVQFEAKKGDVYYIDVVAHRLGSEVDPYLVVERVTKDDKGEETVALTANVDDPGDRNGRIGSNFDSSTDDPTYRFTADQDTTYRVSVWNQYGTSTSDPRHVYRLVIRKPAPDFRVAAVAERVQAPVNAAAVLAGTTSLWRGGTTVYNVQIQRRDGFNDAVELSVEGLPGSVSCPPVIVAPGATSGILIFKAADDSSTWSDNVRVVGKAKVEGQDVVRYARGGVTVWETGNRVQQPANFRTTEEIAFAVVGDDHEKAFVQAGEEKVWETSRGATLEIPLTVVRRDDFKADLTLVPQRFPAEFKPGNVVVKAADGAGKLALSFANAKTKPGDYLVYLRADTKVKHVLNPVAITQAQAEQKQIDAAIAALTPKAAEAVKAKDIAVKAATDAAAAAKVATDAKTAADAAVKAATDAAKVAADKAAAAKEAAAKDGANEDLKKAVTDADVAKTEADKAAVAEAEKQKAADAALVTAQAAAKKAEEAKVAAEKLAADTDATLKRAQAAKPAADKKVTDTTNANKPIDKNVAVISTPIRLRIVNTPLKLTANAPGALKQGAKVELPVVLERLYGFVDPAEVTVELPKGVAGIAVAKVTIAKDQKDGKFELTAAADATPGDHTVTIRVKAKFNKLDVEATQQVVLKVEKVEAK